MRDVKEKLCYIELGFDAKQSPQWKVLARRPPAGFFMATPLSAERFRCPEISSQQFSALPCVALLRVQREPFCAFVYFIFFKTCCTDTLPFRGRAKKQLVRVFHLRGYDQTVTWLGHISSLKLPPGPALWRDMRKIVRKGLQIGKQKSSSDTKSPDNCVGDRRPRSQFSLVSVFCFLGSGVLLCRVPGPQRWDARTATLRIHRVATTMPSSRSLLS